MSKQTREIAKHRMDELVRLQWAMYLLLLDITADNPTIEWDDDFRVLLQLCERIVYGPPEA